MKTQQKPFEHFAYGIRLAKSCAIAYEEGEPEEQRYPGDKNFAVEDLMNIFGMK